MGMLSEPVPVTGFAANYSPIPRMAPPPLGKDMAGGEEKALPAEAPPLAPSSLAPEGSGVLAEGRC
jgi:hypothetical protein